MPNEMVENQMISTLFNYLPFSMNMLALNVGYILFQKHFGKRVRAEYQSAVRGVSTHDTGREHAVHMTDISRAER